MTTHNMKVVPERGEEIGQILRKRVNQEVQIEKDQEVHKKGQKAQIDKIHKQKSKPTLLSPREAVLTEEETKEDKLIWKGNKQTIHMNKRKIGIGSTRGNK